MQRKIESDSSMMEDNKKLRTAEDGTTCDEADTVTGECSDTLVDTEDRSDLAADKSSHLHTTDIDEEHCMSVDVIVEETATAASLSSDNTGTTDDVPANTVESTVTDVIDVDAVDTVAGCGDAQKDTSIDYVSSPQELGLIEYYLEPASDDRPAENVIDVDAEATEAADNQINLSATALSTATVVEPASLGDVAENKVSLEDADEKSCGDMASAGGTERETISSELNGDKSDNHPVTVSDNKSDDHPVSVTDHPVSVADHPVCVTGSEVQNAELVAASTLSSSPVDEISEDANISNKSAKDRAVDDPAGDTSVEKENTEVEVASSTERHDIQRLDAGDNDEVVTEMVEHVAESQDSTADKAAVSDSDVLVEVAQHVMSEDGTDTELGATSSQEAVEPEIEILSVPQTLSMEDKSSVCDVDEALSKPVQHEVNYDGDEKMTDSVDTSQTELSKVLNEEHSLLQKTEDPSDATDGKDVTDKASSCSDSAAELMEMTDQPVSVTEDKHQSLETMDTVVSDCGNMKESAEVMDTATASVENSGRLSVEVHDAEVVSDAEEMPLIADNDAKKPAEMIEKVDISPSKDMEDVMVIDAEDETKKLRPETVTSDDSLQSKDVTDAAVDGAEMTGKDDVAQQKDVVDSSKHHQQPTEVTTEAAGGEDVSQCKAMKNVAVTDNTSMTENVVTTDDSVSHLKEVTHMAVVVDKEEQLHTDVKDKVHTAENNMTQSDKAADTDKCLEESTAVTQPAGMSVMLQEATEVINKVETDAEAVELIHDSGIEHTSDAGDGKISVKNSVETGVKSVSEIVVSEVNGEFHDEKTDEKEEMEMVVESVASSEHAAQ